MSLINNIGTPPTSPSKYTLAISDSGANIHISKQDTPKMAPVIISKDIKSRLPYLITMELSHISTLQLPGLSKQARKIYIFPKTVTAPLI